MKHSSRGEVLHPEHIQRDEVGSVVPEQLAELIAVHESAAGHIEVGNSPEKCGNYLHVQYPEERKFSNETDIGSVRKGDFSS